MPIRSPSAAVLVLALIAGGPALAQNTASQSAAGTAATAPTDPGAPIATTNPAATDAQIRAWIDGSPKPAVAAQDDVDVIVDKPQPRVMHGEAGVTIGSNGYRSVYAATVVPVGQTGTLGVAVSDTSFGKTRGWGRDYARGSDQSLALSLAMDGARPDPAPGCLRVGQRYVEPLWVTQMRGPDDHCAPPPPDQRAAPPTQPTP